ncbi:MAG: phosphodiester glycosidase family protein [Christensenella sp.]
MNNLVTRIPLSKITRIEIYINSGRKKMAAIKKELGCRYIINAGLFDMRTFAPMNLLVHGGRQYAKQGGKFGMSFDGAKVLLSYDNSVKYPEHVSGYPCLIKGSEKAYERVPSGLEGKRGRSAIGLSEKDMILRACDDKAGIKLDELYADMRARGCNSAMNLDGGGSVQCDFYGNRITSGRIVHNFICVWCGGNAAKTVSARTGLNIRHGAPNALGINTSRVIGTYDNGVRVEVLETLHGWGRTDIGWVCGRYLK